MKIKKYRTQIEDVVVMIGTIVLTIVLCTPLFLWCSQVESDTSNPEIVSVNLATQLFIDDQIYFMDDGMKIERGYTYYQYANKYNYSGEKMFSIDVNKNHIVTFLGDI